jgi:hypothetical protein
VKRIAIVLLVTASFVAVAAPDDPYEGGDKYGEPRPYASTVKSVHITRNGLWTDHVSSDETREHCAGFVLRQADVREYFRVSRRASLKEYGHDLDMSRCHATGQVRFANGDRGEWRIDRARRGMVRLSDGRALYFYCEACRAKAFYEP